MKSERKVEVKDMKEFTSRCAEHVRVEGAPTGTREKVLDWMKSHFPGLRETDASNVEPCYRNYKGEVRQYEICDGEYSGEYLYLAEKMGAAHKDEAEKTLAEINAIASKEHLSAAMFDRQLPFIDKMRSLGWECHTVKLEDANSGRRWQFGLLDPDSAKAMAQSPLSACLGDYAKAVELLGKMNDMVRGRNFAEMVVDEAYVAMDEKMRKLGWRALVVNEDMAVEKTKKGRELRARLKLVPSEVPGEVNIP